MSNKITIEFPGFGDEKKQKFFKYPTELENWWTHMSGSEFAVMTFIIRMTAGFHKETDAIAISQFTHGVRGLNKGIGYSRSQVCRAVTLLENKGFINVKRRKYKPSIFSLKRKPVLEDETIGESVSEKILCNHKVAGLMNLFSLVAGHQAQKYPTEQKQVDAMNKLRAYYGDEYLEEVITSLPILRQEYKFSPSINSPVELAEKMPKLVDAINKFRLEKRGRNNVVL